MLKQDCIPEGCVPPACCPYLPACTAGGGGGAYSRKGCLLQGMPVSWGGGGPAPRGVSALGMPAWVGCLHLVLGGACLGGGVSAPGGSLPLVLGVGGLLLEGCLVWGVSAPGRCLLWGGYLPLVLGGVTQHAMGQTPLWTELTPR